MHHLPLCIVIRPLFWLCSIFGNYSLTGPCRNCEDFPSLCVRGWLLPYLICSAKDKGLSNIYNFFFTDEQIVCHATANKKIKMCGDGLSDYVTLIGKAIANISWSSVSVAPLCVLYRSQFCAFGDSCFPQWLSVKPRLLTKKKKNRIKHVSVTGCFTIPFPCFPFCHFSIILGISVRQALFLKLPLFHRFLYFMISTSSSSVVQTRGSGVGKSGCHCDMQTTSW